MGDGVFRLVDEVVSGVRWLRVSLRIFLRLPARKTIDIGRWV